MTDKQLRRLSRLELLELLVEQSRQIEDLQKQLKEAHEQLEDKRIKIENSGTMAEAALKLNHVFEDIKAAEQQYFYNMEQMSLQEEAVEEGWDLENSREEPAHA